MGRPSLSEEVIRNNKISIISAAMDMIRESGISSISARTLGNRVAMNSALIYRYFADIDEVILFACIHVLQEYTADMSKTMAEAGDMTDRDIYLLSWQLFCEHAFTNPAEYNTLFFSKHSSNLQKTIKEYYLLFPYEKSDSDDVILQGMFRTAKIKDRNLLLLIPLLEGKRAEEDIILINDLTIAFFYTLLAQLISADPGLTPTSQTDRMLQACRLLIAT